MNRRERRARAAHPTGIARRPVDDLVLSHAPESAGPYVLVGLAGDGYVRLDHEQARERALVLLLLAGVDEETVGLVRALL